MIAKMCFQALFKAKQNKLSGTNQAYNLSTILNFSAILSLKNFSHAIQTEKLG